MLEFDSEKISPNDICISSSDIALTIAKQGPYISSGVPELKARVPKPSAAHLLQKTPK